MTKATLVEVTSNLQLLNTEDDVILRTAIDGGADLIVTGDRDLLDLQRYDAILIISVSEAMSQFQ